MHKPKLYTHPYHNCLTVTVTGVVHQEVEVEGMWFLSQLYSIRLADNKIRFAPKINFFNDEACRFSTLEINHYTSADYKSFKANLDETLDNSIQLMVPIDTFYLPYCPQYQREHNFHWAHVFHREDKVYKIIDHYYHFIGDINEEILKNAIEGCREILTLAPYQFYSLDTKNYKSLASENFKKAIHINLNSFLSNKEIGKPVPYTIFDDSFISSQGLDVFKDIYSTLESVSKESDEKIKEKIFDDLHDDFLAIGNSRNIFSEFLEKYDTNGQTTELRKALAETAQEYRICANLALRNVVRKQYSAEKILNRLPKLKEKEEIHVKYLMNLSNVL
ncbi:hypothetical protein COK37_20895 [Bacillus thuringiensis]|uniref:BtrH N-terminal domain-containing protein n=1 Tax=Bacillus TaxID=1386 RepID=UPI0005B7477A|nr:MULTISPECIES: BtrH N-terminal domain-containing protein [Bacillus]KIQ78170.1 hypothetical protein RW25_28250 [Bacillus sp. L_1B0_8]KIQ82534.1 hypothetical protein RT27_23810 [Bacillus sp. L_1B0_5]PEV50771.1 hypothetical protein CN432_09210 [Bacillus thuringiensis]PFR65813.1 hypothetical protein COK37_20895 [Bacillus thuringiensis]PFT77412.1 hypothetical protein COK70_19670 [Bacillus thuringiensis]